jgi:hypothetical protein
LAEVIADGAVERGHRCGEEAPADETELGLVVLVEVRDDELEDIEVEAVGGDHEAASVREMIDAVEATAIGGCRKPCRRGLYSLTDAPHLPPLIVVAVVRDAALLSVPGVPQLALPVSLTPQATRFPTSPSTITTPQAWTVAPSYQS